MYLCLPGGKYEDSPRGKFNLHVSVSQMTFKMPVQNTFLSVVVVSSLYLQFWKIYFNSVATCFALGR